MRLRVNNAVLHKLGFVQPPYYSLVRIRFSVWLVSYYAHVFVLL